jgi:hypothetical protein
MPSSTSTRARRFGPSTPEMAARSMRSSALPGQVPSWAPARRRRLPAQSPAGGALPVGERTRPDAAGWASPRARCRWQVLGGRQQRERRQVSLVLGINLREQGMNLIPQPGGFSDGSLALGRKQVEDDAVVFQMDQRQLRRFLPHASSDGASIQAVGLTLTPVVAAKPSGPVRTDLEYGETKSDEVLRQAAPVAPGAFNTPPAGWPKRCGPPSERRQSIRRVRSAPFTELPACFIHGGGNVDGLVCVNPERDQPRPPCRLRRADGPPLSRRRAPIWVCYEATGSGSAPIWRLRLLT